MAAVFDRSIVAVVGIDDYANGIPELHNARRDAEAFASRLEDRGYLARRLLDGVTQNALLEFLDDLVADLKPDDRLVFYFAGHGRAPDASLGQPGCLLTLDADPLVDDVGLVTMAQVKTRLDAFHCRHLLVILDCCYAGSFRWASATRHGEILPSKPFREHYLRYTKNRARQVLTSSADDQKASDALSNPRGNGKHSPFASALFEALDGAADLVPKGGNGLITTTELFAYLRHWVEFRTAEAGRLQTPGFWSLDGHDDGEFVFEVPGREVDLKTAPELTAKLNPYVGLKPLTRDDLDLFFGRTDLIRQVADRLREQPFVALVGASGSGKSSLLQAGVLPRMQGFFRYRPDQLGLVREETWRVVGPVRPGEKPLEALAQAFVESFEEHGEIPDNRQPDAVLDWLEMYPEERLIVAVDQLEELITLTPKTSRQAFEDLLAGWIDANHERLRVIVTLRIDMETGIEGTQKHPRPLQSFWRPARLVVPAMDHVELRQAIRGPAGQRALIVEEDLVRELIKDLQQMPGALSLLSVTLSELYQGYVERSRKRLSRKRRLTFSDYEASGRVGGSISRRANAVVADLIENRSAEEATALQETLKRVMLRMVSLRGSVPSRRRVSLAELDYPDEQENKRVRTLLKVLEAERLVVPAGDTFEPAHDMLIKGWDRLQTWLEEDEVRKDVLLQQRVAEESLEWANGRAGTWWSDPRLIELCLAPELPVSWWRRLDTAPWRPKAWLNRRERLFFETSLKQRRRRWAGRLLAALVAVGLILGLGWVSSKRQAAQRETQSRRLASQSASALADQPDLALLLAAKAWETAENAEARRALLAGLQAHPRLFTQWVGSDGAVEHLSLDPTGERLASVDDAGVKLWSLRDRQLLKRLPKSDGRFVEVDVSPDGRRLGAAGTQGVTLWDLEDLKLPSQRIPIEGASTLAFSPKSDALAVGTSAGEIELVRLDDSSRDRILPDHEGAVTRVVFTPDGDSLISAALESKAPLRVWESVSESDARRSQVLEVGSSRWIGGAHDVDVSSDGRLVAAAREDGGIAVWEIASGSLKLTRRLEESGTAQSVEFLAGDEYLVSAHSDGWILLWSLDDPGASPERFSGHRGGAYSIDARGSIEQFFTGGADARIRGWHQHLSNPLATELWRGPVKVRQVGWLASGGLLELSDGQLFQRVSAFRASERRPVALETGEAVAISPTGGDVLVRLPGHGGHESLEICTVPGGSCSALHIPASFPVQAEVTLPFRAASFSPGGKYLAVVHWRDASRIFLWEKEYPSRAPRQLEVDQGVSEVVFNRQESQLIGIHYGTGLTLWNAETGRRLTAKAIESGVSTAVFSPKGDRLFLGEWTGDIESRSISDLEQVVDSADQHKDSVQVMAADPQGRLLVSADSEGKILLWDTTRLDFIGALQAPDGHYIEDMAFDSTGKNLLTVGFGIYRWNLDVSSWMDLVSQRTNRSLTPEEVEQYLSEVE